MVLLQATASAYELARSGELKIGVEKYLKCECISNETKLTAGTFLLDANTKNII